MNKIKDLINHSLRLVRMSVIACVVLLLAGFLVMQFGSMVAGIVTMSLGLFIVIVAITVFWRCPECDETLPAKSFGTKRCPYCGRELD